MPRLTRHASIAALACALTVPAMAGCEAGLNAPTLQYHPAASGAYTSGDGITISNAFVLGPGVGQQLPAGSQAGLFVSISSANGDTLQSASAPGVAGSVQLTGGTVNIAASNSPDGGGPANLTGPAPQIVLTNLTKPLSGGQTVTVTLTFANAGQIQVQVPVEPQAYAYATYQQPPAPAPTPTATPTPTTSTAASHHKNTKNSKTAKKQKKTSAKAKATTSPSASSSAG